MASARRGSDRATQIAEWTKVYNDILRHIESNAFAKGIFEKALHRYALDLKEGRYDCGSPSARLIARNLDLAQTLNLQGASNRELEQVKARISAVFEQNKIVAGGEHMAELVYDFMHNLHGHGWMEIRIDQQGAEVTLHPSRGAYVDRYGVDSPSDWASPVYGPRAHLRRHEPPAMHRARRGPRGSIYSTSSTPKSTGST